MMIFFNSSNIIFAEQQEIHVVGEYLIGENDTLAQAKEGALRDAKRQISEQVGIKIESYSEANNFNITKDQIKAASQAVFKLKIDKIEYAENGRVCKAYVTGIVDTKSFVDIVKGSSSTSDTNTAVNILSLLQMGGFSEYNGHYYKVYNDTMTWHKAKEYCEKIGGHLVTITSSNEQMFIQQLINTHGTHNSYWLGAFRALPTKDQWLNGISPTDWIWITGEEFLYSNWDDKQPDYYDRKELLLMLWKKSNNNKTGRSFSWNDVPPSYQVDMGFICEWDSYEDIKL